MILKEKDRDILTKKITKRTISYELPFQCAP